MKKQSLSLLSLMIVLGLLLAACGPTPEPQVVEKTVVETVVVEQTVKETVIVEGTPQVVEKVVTEVVENVITATPEPVEEPKILKARLYGDIQNLDPAFQISENDTVVANAVMDGLVRYCPNSYELCNQLAEELEESEDGLQIRFKLREGVMWHNGYGELTAEDVKYSYERFIDPDLDAAYADDWATLDYVEVIDDYNGIIHLKEPFAPLWSSTLPVGSGTIVPKKWIEEIGLQSFATHIIGTGPYMFEQWKPQEMVVLKKNPDYWGEEPYYDEIHLIPIEDDKAAEVALEAGDLDFGLISIPSVERFEANSDFEVVTRPSLRYYWVGMNVQHPKLQDPNVRWAVIYGIDVDSILQAAYMGKAERACAIIPPGLIGYWEDAPCYERDVEKAKEYLAAAGLESLDLRLDLQDTTEERTWAEIIQQNLAEVGINVELNPMDSSTYWTTTFGDQAVENNELMVSSYSMQPDPAWATMWFTCDQVGVWNAEAWCNEEYDALHYEAMVTLDPEERADLYIQMQQIWDEAAQTVWVTYGARPYAYNPDIVPATTPNGKPQYESFSAAE
ncbi:MAG: ABC transporter substrate-binding protein [Anaerolineae bacterium]|jgi:peptide/nickel transport system substrate-binding protein